MIEKLPPHQHEIPALLRWNIDHPGIIPENPKISFEKWILTVEGEVGKPLRLNWKDFLKLPSIESKSDFHCVEGWSVTILWEGVLIKDLLEAAEVSQEANTVIFYAYDGYSTSLPLEYVIDNDILMAYRMNNVILPPERGYPFQLVAESKWGYKWIKWITTIELSNNEEYRGYWELRGYSNNGDLDKSFYGENVNPGEVIPEFPSALILPILIGITLVAIIFRKNLFKDPYLSGE